MKTAPALLLALAAAPVLAACIQSYPQRLPGPLFLPPEETATTPPTSAAYVTVQRDSDPVWVRKPGERGDVSVPFYAKRQRVPVGSLVRTGAGGRAELLWLPDATSLVLFDAGRATLGDAERGEPVLRLHAVTRALLTVTPEDEIELVGGARLSGDEAEPTGPVLLEQGDVVLRVTNQSKRVLSVAYRSERLALGPGESIDLPLVPGGSAPEEEPGTRLQGAGVAVRLSGEVERSDGPLGLTLTARTPAVLHAQGVAVRLEPGGSARFSGFEPPPAENPPAPEPRP